MTAMFSVTHCWPTTSYRGVNEKEKRTMMPMKQFVLVWLLVVSLVVSTRGFAATAKTVQIGGSNFGKDVTGAQIGIFNGGVVVVDSNERIMPSHRGAQIGLYNTVNDVSGIQIGAVNAGEVVDGVQIGLANGGGNVNGLQVGLANGKVGLGTCVQIGVLNIAHKGIKMPLLNVSLD